MGEGRAGLPRFAALLLAGASLTACASTADIGPKYSTRPSSAPPAASTPSRPAPQMGAYKVGKPYQVNGIWYTPREQPDYDEIGLASWYGDAFQLRPTASGEPFDMFMVSAAHKTLPLQSIVEVTNLENGRVIQVRINDRGPFVDGRIIDMSRAAAEELGMIRTGVARVRVRFVGVAGSKPLPPFIVASNPAPRTEAAKPLVITMAPIPNPPEPVRTAAPAPAGFEVQAAAFADPANAERVRRQLSSSGQVEVRALQRDDGLYYRVVVCSLADEAQAMAVQQRLAAQGFAEARVIRPF